jgi:hypothetical protein
MSYSLVYHYPHFEGNATSIFRVVEPVNHKNGDRIFLSNTSFFWPEDGNSIFLQSVMI